MENLLKAASYIATRYKNETGETIDEMKLHKLLYFSQREALVLTDSPLFSEEFEAWKYGPVMVPIRDYYKQGMPEVDCDQDFVSRYKNVFDNVFRFYSKKRSWDLSVLSHGESCWRNAFESNVPHAKITLDAMYEDVRWMRERYERYKLAQM